MRKREDASLVQEISEHMAIGQEHNVAPVAYTAMLILDELRKIRELLEIETGIELREKK